MVNVASVSELPDEIDNDGLSMEDQKCSVTLFYVLALLLKGKALAIPQTIKETLGIEAWRQLTHEFEPKVAGRFSGMLDQLLKATPGDDVMRTITTGMKSLDTN